MRWIFFFSLLGVVALVVSGQLGSSHPLRTKFLLCLLGLAVAAPLLAYQFGVPRRFPWLILAGVLAIVISQACYQLLVWTGWQSQSLLWRLWLTFVGFTLGAPLADFQLRMKQERPGLAWIGLPAIAVSQVSYLLLVWTEFAMDASAWRVWWISMVVSVNMTHLRILHVLSDGRRGMVDRVTPWCAVSSTVMIGGVALYTKALQDVTPFYMWLCIVVSSLSVAGTLIVWGHWFAGRSRDLARSPRRAVAWLVVTHACLFAVGIYIGRTGKIQGGSYEAFPSAMSRMDPEAIHAQTLDDLARLRIAVDGIQELEGQVNLFASELAQALGAEGRSFYRPDEDDRIRWLFTTYLAHRTTLLRLIAT